MSALMYLRIFGIAFTVFLLIDLIWLGLVAKGVYAHFMGDMLREKPIWPTAILFYALFVVGLVYFALAPAISAGSLQDAMVRGALYGFFTYATFDLTSHAVLKGFPLGIVPIDMAWGTFLAFSVSTVAYTVNRALG